MFMRDFKDISKDIGSELKQSAERIYTIGISIERIILVLGIVAAIITGFDTEEFGLFLLIAIGTVAEYYIACGIIYQVTIRLYAEGEKVHLLEQTANNTAVEIAYEGEPVAKLSTPTAAAATAFPAPHGQPNTNKPAPANGWKCTCGRVNADYVSSCACGKSKWDQ